ncbi:CD3337/EF1877 family mobilome membrane protein [Lapidilactobacillus dextrinicus]|uniref:CD3337/EF1877 family mobilome membrane protein n=1 Tax=Lapidilactobacillus dextrinicus TaxID=51664 RepID=UPI000AF6B6E7|nr:FUSC family protein [Lapidilactobacillus dextrinicus]
MSIKQKRLLRFLSISLLIILCIILTNTSTVHASGLVDETVNANNEFSKYPVNNYQLDYFVDSSWDWLPWNWGDGIGKSVMYAVYAITNFLWLVSVYLSYATGYLIQQAYSLDFIKDTTDAIGQNIQNLAGVSPSGFSTDGFYPGMLLLLIIILGIYVTYTGLLKRETSKAISAIVNFVVIFITSASFIAYSPDYISKINEFSSDMSTSALNIGSKMMMSNATATSENGVNAIRNTLFNIQVKQPWTLLQFGDSDTNKIGEKRIDELVKTDPFEKKGKARTELVKSEIEEKDNDNLSAVKTINRLGVTTFVIIFNVIITIFVFMLVAIMIFSQILFIIYSIFLPISCLLAMIPGFNSMMKNTIMKLFNAIMMRAGITLVLTMAFCISTMIYSLSATTPFFLVAFLQIVTFGGIWFKLSDLMGMMQLKSSDSQSGARQLAHRGQRAFRNIASGAVMGGVVSRSMQKAHQKERSKEKAPQIEQKSKNVMPKKENRPINPVEKLGRKIGNTLDTKQKITDQAKKATENIVNTPTNAKYNLHQGKKSIKHGVNDFKNGITKQRSDNQTQREQAQKKRREQLATRKLAINPSPKKFTQEASTIRPMPSVRKLKQLQSSTEKQPTVNLKRPLQKYKIKQPTQEPIKRSTTDHQLSEKKSAKNNSLETTSKQRSATNKPKSPQLVQHQKLTRPQAKKYQIKASKRGGPK